MAMPIICLLVGFALWYFTYGVTCYLNGASTWTHPYWMPFQCLWQEIGWLIPGRKAAYIREIIGYDENGKPYQGVICGSKRSWHYKDIVNNNLYAACARDVLPGLGHFLIQHVLIPFGPFGVWFAIKYHW